MNHFAHDDAPPIGGDVVKKLGKIASVLLVILILLLLFSRGCGKTKAQVNVSSNPVTTATTFRSETNDQRAERERLAIIQQKMLPNGNTTQPHTIIGEATDKDGMFIHEISVDGTNPDEWAHHIALAMQVGPGKTIEILLRASNPLECLDYNAWGSCTPIWGERFNRRLRETEEIEFFSERDDGRFADQYGTLFIVLLDPNTGKRIPGEYGKTWAAFNPHQYQTSLRYTNTETRSVKYDIALHRNLLRKQPNPLNPSETESAYSASGWRGDQYWKLKLMVPTNVE